MKPTDTVEEKVNIDLINEWIKELRSGRYKQTSEMLYNAENQGFCCLGVACNSLFDTPIQTLEGEALPDEIDGPYPKWFTDINNRFKAIYGHSLSDLNDSGSYNFDEIADALQLVYIEKALGDV